MPEPPADTTPRPTRRVIISAVVLFLIGLRVAYFLQLRTSPFAFVSSAGLDAGLNHSLAQDLLHGQGSPALALASAYTYFLAAWYRVAGVHVELVWLLQMIMGLGSCVLIWRIARRLFGPDVAVIALALQGTSAVLLFYEGLLVSTTAGIFLSLLVTNHLLRLEDTGAPPAGCYLVGLLVGLLCKIINVAVPLAIVIPLWMLTVHAGVPRKPSRAVLTAAGILTAFILLTLPQALLSRDAGWVPAHSGVNLYLGNHPDADGLFHPLPNMRSTQLGLWEDSRSLAERELGRPLSTQAVNRFWVTKAIRAIVEHPGSWLALVARKLCLFLNGYEPNDIEDFYFAKRLLPIFRLPLPSFYLIAPLGLLGWWLSRTHPRASILGLMLISYGLSNVLYFVNSRYRLPAVPYFLLFASYSLWWIWGRIRAKALTSVVGFGCALVGAVLVTHLRWVEHDFSFAFYNLGVRYTQMQQLSQASEATKESIRIKPLFPEAYFSLGNIAYQQGQAEQAQSYFLEALHQHPQYFEAMFNLGLLNERTGRVDHALHYYHSALAIRPADARLYVNIGCAYLATHRPARASEAFQRAHQLNPSWDEQRLPLWCGK